MVLVCGGCGHYRGAVRLSAVWHFDHAVHLGCGRRVVAKTAIRTRSKGRGGFIDRISKQRSGKGRDPDCHDHMVFPGDLAYMGK